jgi:hypothetical protein
MKDTKAQKDNKKNNRGMTQGGMGS